MTCDTLRLCTWNIKGSHSPIKRKKIWSYLKKGKIDIAMLQETHLNDEEHLKLQQCGFDQVYFSSFTTKSRGVAILIRKNLPVKVSNCIKDKYGRFVLILASLYGEDFALLNVYCPPCNSLDFLIEAFGKLSDLGVENTIVGGDFNCLINPLMDRLPLGRLPLSKQSKQIIGLCEDYGYVDVWRTLHPAEKEFTFFSNPHRCYTRIDYFFAPKQLIESVSCSIGNIIISDHAAVYMNMTLKKLSKKPASWRMDTSILKDHKFISYFNAEFRHFLDINSPSVNDSSLLWETSKAYARGLIISYTATKRRKNMEQQTLLEKRLSMSEKEYFKKSTAAKLKEITAIRSTLDSLLTKKAGEKLGYAKQRLFEHGDKPGRYLANLSKKKRASQMIESILDESGACSSDPKIINAAFRNFYTNLYQSEQTNNSETLMDAFFSELDIPTISQDQKSKLNAPISTAELLEAIQLLRTGKAPGSDGLGSEFYKEFHNLLLEPMMNMFNHSFECGTLPPSLREANISLILKKGKCPEDCASYRPISLLNVDLKILSKVLARRLEDLLPIIVREDQTGFIKGRNSYNNIRRLLNIIQISEQHKIDGLVISLDAEKAFDRVEWSYLFSTLDRFGLGDSFVRWVKVLYTQPMASVVTNGLRSTNFFVQRGTRQGCPLSPLLFAVAVEPLAEAIRRDPLIAGLDLGGKSHKITLYADDVLLFMLNPSVSVPQLIQIIDRFAAFSGYKVNFSKSEAMPLGNLQQPPDNPNPFPFKWSPTGFIYLGIYITPKFNQLFQANFNPLFEKIKCDLERWNFLPISWLGRISLLKMNVLPRLLYPIQMIPILFNHKIVKRLNGWFKSFIWSKRRPRIKLSVLQLPGKMGGMDLPDIKRYQLSAHLRYIADWIKDDALSIWLGIEKSLSNCPLKSLLFIDKLKDIKKLCSNPVTINTIRAWRATRRMEGRTGLTSVFTPIADNPNFLPGTLDRAFQDWAVKGISSLGDLFLGSTLMSFSQIREKYDISRHDLFRYFQVRDFIRKDTSLLADMNVTQIEKQIFLSQGDASISNLYAGLRDCSNLCTRTLGVIWERELDVVINEELWEDIWDNAKKITVCNRTRAMQFKILHRAHVSPVRLSKYRKDVSPFCLKCRTEIGDLTHCFWSCAKIQKYWSSILFEMQKVLKVDLELDPVSLVLGLPSVHVTDRHHKKLYNVMTFCARKNILLQWISDKAPSVMGWHRTIMEYIPLDFLTCLLHSKTSDFERIWNPFLDYINVNISAILARAFL